VERKFSWVFSAQEFQEFLDILHYVNSIEWKCRKAVAWKVARECQKERLQSTLSLINIWAICIKYQWNANSAINKSNHVKIVQVDNFLSTNSFIFTITNSKIRFKMAMFILIVFIMISKAFGSSKTDTHDEKLLDDFFPSMI